MRFIADSCNEFLLFKFCFLIIKISPKKKKIIQEDAPLLSIKTHHNYIDRMYFLEKKASAISTSFTLHFVFDWHGDPQTHAALARG